MSKECEMSHFLDRLNFFFKKDVQRLYGEQWIHWRDSPISSYNLMEEQCNFKLYV